MIDIRMPPSYTNEGLRAAQEIRRAHPDVGTLVLSQYVEVDYVLKLLNGASERVGYLLKDRIADVAEFSRTRARHFEEELSSSPRSSPSSHAPTARDPLAELTPREQGCSRLSRRARPTAASPRSSSSRKTVEAHVRSILGKLDLPADASENRRIHSGACLPPGELGFHRCAEHQARIASVDVNADDDYPFWIPVAALAVILAPTVALLACRRRIGLMNTAAALVTWGALAAHGERDLGHSTGDPRARSVEPPLHRALLHGGRLRRDRRRPPRCDRAHAAPRGRRSGWFVVLFVTLVGGSLEIAMNGPAGHLYHHIGLGYVVAQIAALVIACARPSRPLNSTAALSVP